MRTLNAANLAAAKSEVPWVVDLVKIIIDPNDSAKTVRLTTHFSNLTVSGDGEYIAAGEFLSFGDITDNLEATDNSLDLHLSGVTSTFTAIFLDNTIEGSLVEVFRGYYDESTGDLVAAPEPRWSGRVDNSSIQDDYRFTDDDKIIISVSCKSLLSTMLKRQNGRYTSLPGFQRDNPDDLSMEFVASLVDFSPSFGKEND